MTRASSAARAALDACQADGYRVSVAVVDRHGVMRVQLHGDGAGPHTLSSSAGKAFTAASMRRSTAEYAGLIADKPALGGLRDMDERLLFLAGGLPIRFDGEVVAGIGVGGAPGGDLDEACARAGLEAIGAEVGESGER
ncbi:GlcG/HbpS family heme-binding protein [Arhodomonas sp. AD133]|uniref:GlcG/HbpS family heme-binding protein n=1 Tax=Arhodomonas sp. AD133 TaxID=3415009 RepID=UPI003EBB0E80